MVEEMNSEITNIKPLEKGEIVKGKVAKIEEKQAIVDVGYKFDGILPIGEISNIHIETIEDVLNIGDEVNVMVLRLNDEEEKLILSKKVVDSEKAWDQLKEKAEAKETFEVTIADIVKGGLVADLGVRGFIPASLVEKHFVEDFSDYKGKNLSVKIVELDEEKKRVILSHKAVIDEEEEQKKLEVFDKIKVGDIVEGTIQRLTDFGAFVDLGGIDGLVHVSEIDWQRVERPSDVLKEGETTKVKIIRIDQANQRISLSIKATKQSPFAEAAKTLKTGDIYTGIVRRITNFGAFVELLPNVEGLVHINQISHHHISKISDVLEVNQEVNVKILSLDPENERISLSIREAEDVLREANKAEYEDQKGLNLTLGDVFGEELKKFK